MTETRTNELNLCDAAKRLAARMVEGDDHWSLAAQKLLAGMLSYWLHLALQGQLKAEFTAMDAELANPELPLDQLWQQMHAHCPAVADAVYYVRSLPRVERACVESIALAASFAALERVLSDTGSIDRRYHAGQQLTVRGT